MNHFVFLTAAATSDDMTSALTSFFESVGTFFGNLFTFIYNFFADVVYVIELLYRLISDIPNYFSWLPEAVLSLLVVIFTIVIIYQVLGRE